MSEKKPPAPPWRSAVGRPTKLTEEVVDTVCWMVAAGARHEVAAQAAGISLATFQGWKRRGEKEKSGVYHEFLRALTIAENHGQVHHLGVITKSGAAGSMWILQRRFPDLYSETSYIKIEVRKGLESMIEQAAEVLPQEWLDVLLVAWGARPNDAAEPEV